MYIAIHDDVLERVVDAGVVLREHDEQTLAHLQCERLGLQLLRVACAERELTLPPADLRPPDWRPDHVPERGFASGRGKADARRTAVHVVALIDRFNVPGKRMNAAPPFFRLCEERVVGEPLVLQQRLQRAGAAAEAERVDREKTVLGRDVVLLVAGRLELPVGASPMMIQRA